jgi:hypothetical protein
MRAGQACTDLQFVPINESEADAAALAEFLVGDEWPYHRDSRPSRETVERSVHRGQGFGSVAVRWLTGYLSGDITPIEL